MVPSTNHASTPPERTLPDGAAHETASDGQTGGEARACELDNPVERLKAGRRPEIEALRQALSHMSGAERRLRGRDHSRPGEVTTMQLRLLAALAREREMTAGQLARSVDVNPATVTGMLDHLEEADIVKRDRSTVDRRVCNVSLTAHGWELLERRLARWQSLWEDTLADLSAEELLIAVRVMQGVTELYGEISKRLDPIQSAEQETERIR